MRRPSHPARATARATALTTAVLTAVALLPLASSAEAGTEATYRQVPAAAHRTVLQTRHDHTPAAHGTHRFTTTDATVSVVVGPMNDIPVDLDTRLYVPDNASAKHPQPAILLANGFGNSKDSNEIVDTARFFAAHGYVVETYSAAGFGKSGGCITLQSADYDVKGDVQLIAKQLAPRKDVLHDKRGPVVGTMGGSYGGAIQLNLAAADKAVRASVVGRTWNNLQYSLDPNNRIAPGDPTGLTHGLDLQGVFKLEWTSLFYASGQSQPAMGNGGCPQAKAASGDPTEIAAAGSCLGYYLPLCTTYEGLASTGNLQPAGRQLVRRASPSTFLRKVRIPVLLTQGQSDTLFNLNDASATYLALKRQHTPVGMIWNAGGHGGYDSQPGECEVYDGTARTTKQLDDCYLSLRALGWMNHWLRHTKAGRGPAFTYYRDWAGYAGKGADDEQYGFSTRFPLPTTTTFTLSGNDYLAGPHTAVVAGSQTMTNPAGGEPAAYTETSNETGPDASPNLSGVKTRDIPGQFADFSSPAFLRDTASVGIPTAHLRMSHVDGQDLVFYAKLFDVAPNGVSTSIHRLIAPVRVPAAAVGKPIDIKLDGIAHLFKKGHRVRLVLCTTDQTSYNAKVADVITVLTGRGSTFTLPTSTP